MIPSDHFVRFYNEVFKFLDARNALEPYYREVSRHQELHCLELFRKEGLKGVMKYYERIKVEENCGLEMEFLPDRLISRMTKCPSLSKVLDSDAEPCPKYCDHCSGWGVPLYTKCGIYYVENMISRTEPRCVAVRTESREVARKCIENSSTKDTPPTSSSPTSTTGKRSKETKTAAAEKPAAVRVFCDRETLFFGV